MQDNFSNIKRKKFIRAIAMSVLIGVSFAFIVDGIILNILRRQNIFLSPWYYVGIAIGSTFLLGLGLFLFLVPTDKRVAKKLDKTYAMREKVQTLVEFKNDESDMVRLQREDAQKRLKNLPIKFFSVGDIVVGAVALLLACVLFVTGILVPITSVDPGSGGKPPVKPLAFSITEYQRVSLLNLIEAVEGSEAEETVKTFTKGELQTLYDALDTIETAETLYEKVGLVIVGIDTMVETVNTYKKIYLSLRASEVESVQLLAKAIGNQDAVNRFKTLRYSFANDAGDKDTAKTALDNFEQTAKTALETAEVAKTDALYLQVGSFLSDISDLLEETETYSYSYAYMQNLLEGVFNNNAVLLDVLLAKQKKNREIVTDCIEKLIEIFGIPADKVPSWGGDSLIGLEDDSDREDNGESGQIQEGVKYPSDEKIYDYYTKRLEAYGVFFDGKTYNYKGTMNNAVEGNEEIPSEIKDIVDIYISLLSGVEVEQE